MRAAGSAAVGHFHDVGAALEGLVEVADVAGDVFVAGDGEGDDGLGEVLVFYVCCTDTGEGRWAPCLQSSKR